MTGIAHSTIATAADDPTAEINRDEWNDDHVVPATGFELGVGGPTISAGADAPEGSVVAPPGSLYLRTTGLVYLKTTGTGDTGWSEGVTFG